MRASGGQRLLDVISASAMATAHSRGALPVAGATATNGQAGMSAIVNGMKFLPFESEERGRTVVRVATVETSLQSMRSDVESPRR